MSIQLQHSVQVKYHRLKLLKHPFISHWIEERWKAARVIYMFLFISYTCFLSFLTAYSLTTPNPILSSNCKWLFNYSMCKSNPKLSCTTGINETLGSDSNNSFTSDRNIIAVVLLPLAICNKCSSFAFHQYLDFVLLL